MSPDIQSLTPIERMAACREHLLKLGRCEVEPWFNKNALCFELKHKLGIEQECLILKFQEWPESVDESGLYPVEGEEFYDKLVGTNRWHPSTKFGAKRRRLCLWLADNLTIDMFE